ncbi:MAG: RND family transporter, partial [Sphingobacteriia bacterium]|nr:RND family transporter [Sphingobacteriia bacterium]
NEKLLKEITGIFEKSGMNFYASGDLYLQLKILDYVIRIVTIIPPLAMILMLLVFRWRVGTFKGTFLAIFPAGLGALWTMGFLGWTGNELSLTSVLVPVFTIVMGSADGLHFMSHYIDNRKRGMEKTVCMSDTLKKVGKPMVLTTVTTVMGFMSLTVVKSSAMQQMGVFASIGVAFAGIATWVFLPLLADGVKSFAKNKKNGETLKKDVLNEFLESIWGKKSVVFSIVLLIAFIPGIFLIRTDLNMLSMYKPETDIRKGIEKIQEATGGGLPLFITYKTDSDIFGEEYADRVMEFERKLYSEGLITKYVSVYDIFSTFNKILYGNSEYPKNQVQLNLMYGMLSTQKNNPVSNFINRSENLGRILVFPRDLSGEILDEIQKISQDDSDGKINFAPVGIQYIMKGMNDSIIPEQVKSLLLAVIMVFLVLYISYRKLSVAFFSIVPICITLVSLFGVMGYAGITLSIITSTMASITIGVGIDYAIH